MKDYLKQAAFALIYCVYLLLALLLLDWCIQEENALAVFVVSFMSGIIAAAGLYFTVQGFRALRRSTIKGLNNVLDKIES